MIPVYETAYVETTLGSVCLRLYIQYVYKNTRMCLCLYDPPPHIMLDLYEWPPSMFTDP
jgi:hypothetical protein